MRYCFCLTRCCRVRRPSARDFARLRQNQLWKAHTAVETHASIRVDAHGLRGVVADKDLQFGDVISIQPRETLVCDADIPADCMQGIVDHVCARGNGRQHSRYQQCTKDVAALVFPLQLAARKATAPKGSALEGALRSAPE